MRGKPRTSVCAKPMKGIVTAPAPPFVDDHRTIVRADPAPRAAPGPVAVPRVAAAPRAAVRAPCRTRAAAPVAPRAVAEAQVARPVLRVTETGSVKTCNSNPTCVIN
uniref:RRM domain-containing protein n=1 Tax=Steinernema glaseri TaxID=37863 RepID=A0A1I7Y6X5_9BILA